MSDDVRVRFVNSLLHSQRLKQDAQLEAV
jgi:hypothetical protein